MHFRVFGLLTLFSLAVASAYAEQAGQSLPGTAPLEWEDDDLSGRNVDGMHRFLDRVLAGSPEARERSWKRDFSSAEAYAASVEQNRLRLKKIVGAIDPRRPGSLQTFSDVPDPEMAAESRACTVRQVRWQALEGVWGEGLLLEPKTAPVASVVALPDADHTPEQLSGLAPGVAPGSQFARILAENGCRVLVPVLIDRSSEFSNNPELASTRNHTTNMPHREWLYRMGYQMGRHLIGFEVQKVLSAVDRLKAVSTRPVAVAGYGEGGLIAFCAAAVDPRIYAALVSGYFQPREQLWQEPIYRNVWSLLSEFGDAGIASLIIPRPLIIENSTMPRVDGPPASAPGRPNLAAPGRISDPPVPEVLREFERVRAIWKRLPAAGRGRLELVPANGRLSPGSFGSRAALELLLRALGSDRPLEDSAAQLQERRRNFDARERQRRQVRQIQEYVQDLLRVAGQHRDDAFLNKMPKTAAGFAREAARYRKQLHEEVTGKVFEPMLPAHARTRLRYDREKWRGYDVVLDVWPDVFAWGVLLVPRNIKPGERRPVVVTQHGLESIPPYVVEASTPDSKIYREFAARLADMGFVVYAPFNPYRGHDRFRSLQRKANPLKLSLFSFIIGQHRQTLAWLETLPFVDGSRIGFYGLSYGGKSAMRIPAVVEDYALSICSGDFTEWIWQNATVDWANGTYMYAGEYEMPDFDLGMTFNYAEMAYLIFPRPFMVERGHRDGNGIDEWVGYEYAKVRRLYDELGFGSRTEIEYFNGGHVINGEGTFEFLRRHLGLRQE